MQIIGHGVDIVEIARIGKLLEDPEQDFVAGVFTALEQKLAPAGPVSPSYYAGRFSAKEAVVKALGTGFSRGISWADIEIARGDLGAPIVVLSGPALEVGLELGVTRWLLSISHCQCFAVASAIAVGE